MIATLWWCEWKSCYANVLHADANANVDVNVLFMECLMQKSLLDMQTWMQPYNGANEDFVMQMSFMRMQMQMYVLVMHGFAPAWACRCKCNQMVMQMKVFFILQMSSRKLHMRMLYMWCRCLNQYSWMFKNLLQHFCSKTGYLV